MWFLKKINYQDIFFVVFIVALSFFLIGYYLNYEYLITGYQDWIYHAFRVKSISEYGITSWDHKWANGINYWRNYQFIPHLLILWTVKFFPLSITKAMILWTVVLFFYLKLSIYFMLRYLKVEPLPSFLAVLISFLAPVNWTAMKDFSIFIGLLFLPIFIFLWIKSTNLKIIYLPVAAMAGFFWNVHPVIGLFCCSLLVFDFLLNKKIKIIQKVFLLMVMMIGGVSFLVDYFANSYHFAHPYHLSSNFVVGMLITRNFGLNIIYFFLLGFSWLVLFLRPQKIDYWFKILLIFVSILIIAFLTSQRLYNFDFLNFTQYHRTNLLVSLVTPFLFAVSINRVWLKIRSAFFNLIITALIAIATVFSLEANLVWSAEPTNNYFSEVAAYFSEKKPQGTIYFENESELSYFTDQNIRLVGSYNEHLLPGPMSYLFKRILRAHVGYLDITSEQLALIEDYMHVLGVEYLVLPYSSPIVKNVKLGKAPFLKYENEIDTNNATYTVLRNTRPITYAYIVDYQDFKNQVGDNVLPNPTLNSQSILPWNELIKKYAKFFQSENVFPLQVNFIHPNLIRITMPKNIPEISNQIILINQSYDKNWKVGKNGEIHSNNLRFIKLNLVNYKPGEIIELANNWPFWHWPLKIFNFAFVFFVLAGAFFYCLVKRSKEI